METQEIRDEVAKHAPSERATWPNGLGFSWRGWEYSCGHRGWAATKGDWLGYGETPADAKANAFQQPNL